MFGKKPEYLGDEYEPRNTTKYIGDEYEIFKRKEKSEPSSSAIQNYNAKPKNGCTCDTPKIVYQNKYNYAKNNNSKNIQQETFKGIRSAFFIIMLLSVLPTIISVILGFSNYTKEKSRVKNQINTINRQYQELDITNGNTNVVYGSYISSKINLYSNRATKHKITTVYKFEGKLYSSSDEIDELTKTIVSSKKYYYSETNDSVNNKRYVNISELSGK